MWRVGGGGKGNAKKELQRHNCTALLKWPKIRGFSVTIPLQQCGCAWLAHIGRTERL
jgi:hypothetical protein